jgi:hypothetical protein
MANQRARLDKQLGTPHSDQDDHGHHHRNRRSRLHGHAERTMVGIAFKRMDVCYLGHGQKRQ